MVRWLWPVCGGLLLLAACDGSSAGGHGGGPGGGGTGGATLGTDPDAGYGGAGGVPIELSFVTWAARSAWWRAYLPEVPWLSDYALVLDEEAGACEGQTEERFGPGPHRLVVSLAEPGVGACPMDRERTEGCRVGVAFRPGGARGFGLWSVPAASATLRIERFAGGALAGELRASFPVNPELQTGVGGSSSGESWLHCTGLTGVTRECTVETPGQDCCNEGKPLEEIVVPFEASFCPPASDCEGDEFCEAAQRAAACPPAAVECAIACANLSEGCGSCTDCDGDPDCEAWHAASCARVVEACPAECAAANGQPAASIGMACLAAGATCDGWNSCLSTCGGDR